MIKVYFVLFTCVFISNSLASMHSAEESYKPRKASRAERFSDEESDQKSSDEEEKFSKNSKPGKQPKLVRPLHRRQDIPLSYPPQNEKNHTVTGPQAFPPRRDSALSYTPIEVASPSIPTRYDSAVSQTPNDLQRKNDTTEEIRFLSLSCLNNFQGRSSSSLKGNEKEVGNPSRQRPQNNFFTQNDLFMSINEESGNKPPYLSENKEKEENSDSQWQNNPFNEIDEESDEELNEVFIKKLQVRPQSTPLELP